MARRKIEYRPRNILVYIDVNNPPPNFVVAEDYYYNGLKVPRGFRTDFTSLPAVMRMFLNPVDETAIAAMVHDMLYIEQFTTRRQADRIFLDIMRHHRVRRWKRNMYYVGIRLFGWGPWYKKKLLRKLQEKGYISEVEYKKLRKNGL